MPSASDHVKLSQREDRFLARLLGLNRRADCELIRREKERVQRMTSKPIIAWRHRCLRCKQHFTSKDFDPKACGKCKSTLWNKKRERKVGK